jgi:hypothetical protein
MLLLFSFLSLASATILDGQRLSDVSTDVSSPVLISRKTDANVDNKFLKHILCRGPHLDICPNFVNDCSRAVLDNKFQASDITALHDIAAKGMGARDKLGGPTILDINTVGSIACAAQYSVLGTRVIQ